MEEQQKNINEKRRVKMEHIVEFDKISKNFGKHKVVDEISFTIEKGELFGLLGPNGAGKSTSISMLSGLMKPSSGRILVNGKDIAKYPKEGKRCIGLVPQDIALYPTLSAQDNLYFWGRMYGLSGKRLKEEVDRVLKIANLEERRKDIVKGFSGGMKRRINIAAALLHRPQLLIMDEPTVGIDPQSRNSILETVKELNEEGMSVIYTSHYMEEVEFLCNRIGIIDLGKLLMVEEKEKLKQEIMGSECIELKINHEEDSIINGLSKLEFITKVHKNENGCINVYLHDPSQHLQSIVHYISEQGVNITQFSIQEPNLENVFLKLTGKALRD